MHKLIWLNLLSLIGFFTSNYSMTDEERKNLHPLDSFSMQEWLAPEPWAAPFCHAADSGIVADVQFVYNRLTLDEQKRLLTTRCCQGIFRVAKGPEKFTGLEFVCTLGDPAVMHFILTNLPPEVELSGHERAYAVRYPALRRQLNTPDDEYLTDSEKVIGGLQKFLAYGLSLTEDDYIILHARGLHDAAQFVWDKLDTEKRAALEKTLNDRDALISNLNHINAFYGFNLALEH